MTSTLIMKCLLVVYFVITICLDMSKVNNLNGSSVHVGRLANTNRNGETKGARKSRTCLNICGLFVQIVDVQFVTSPQFNHPCGDRRGSMKLKVGDKVKTIKGDQLDKNARNEILTVVKIGKKWRAYPATVCENPFGQKTLYLTKNLVKI